MEKVEEGSNSKWDYVPLAPSSEEGHFGAETFVKAFRDGTSVWGFFEHTVYFQKKNCPGSRVEIVSKSWDSLIYETVAPGCGYYGVEYDLVRLQAGHTGFHTLLYEMEHGSLSPEQRAQWLDILTAARLKSGR